MNCMIDLICENWKAQKTRFLNSQNIRSQLPFMTIFQADRTQTEHDTRRMNAIYWFLNDLELDNLSILQYMQSFFKHIIKWMNTIRKISILFRKKGQIFILWKHNTNWLLLHEIWTTKMCFLRPNGSNETDEVPMISKTPCKSPYKWQYGYYHWNYLATLQTWLSVWCWYSIRPSWFLSVYIWLNL